MNKNKNLSIIIPTYNEQDNIGKLVNFLHKNVPLNSAEIIVSDGGSSDRTLEVAAAAGANAIQSPKKGRSAQMNFAASIASSEILYFLHADCIPPPGFTEQILEQINKGIGIGCFRLKFDMPHWFLDTNAWFTRFDINAFRYGDQSLFVTKSIFKKAGGYNEKLTIMEDFEIIHRLKKFGKFKVMPDQILTSARKYAVNGVFRMQAIFYFIYLLYKIGMPQQKLVKLYCKLVKQDKLQHETK